MYELPLGLHELIVDRDRQGGQRDHLGRSGSSSPPRSGTCRTCWTGSRRRVGCRPRRTSSCRTKLDAARKAEAAGNDNKAIKQLAAFRDARRRRHAGPRGGGPGRPSIRDADAMIVRLGGTASKAGVKANAGEPLKGTGRLGGDATRLAPGRQL